MIALALAVAAAADADLAWLSGQWRETKGDVVTEELWGCPAAGVVLGVNRVLRAGKVASYEHMAIQPDADGRPTFAAALNGEAATRFVSTTAAPGRLVFANPRNTFPQAIRYAREGDVLAAAIFGKPDDTAPAQTWRFTKVASLKCD